MGGSLSKLKRIGELRISTVAGAWVFYFLAALIPLLFLLITAFAVFGVDITADITYSLPAEFKDAGEAIINAAENASRGVTVFFIITVFVSGSALLSQMKKDGEYIYGVKSTSGGLLKRVWAIVALGVLFTVFMCIALFFSFEKYIYATVFGGIHKIWITVTVFAVVVVACFFVNAMLNAFVSPVKLSFLQAAVGGAVSLSVIILGTIGFILYLRLFNPYNLFYGSLATVMVFLIWTYILMLGLVIGVATSKRAYFKAKKEA